MCEYNKHFNKVTFMLQYQRTTLEDSDSPEPRLKIWQRFQRLCNVSYFSYKSLTASLDLPTNVNSGANFVCSEVYQYEQNELNNGFSSRFVASTLIVIPSVRKLKREGPRFKTSLSNRLRPLI